MTSPQPDFSAIEDTLRDQADHYRERHHSTKLSLYSGFFAFDGLTLAAAALLSTSTQTHPVVFIVLALSLASCVILFLQFHWLLTFYDAMGYSKISIRRQEDIDRYYESNESHRSYFRRRRRLRRLLDKTLFVFAFCQIGLMGLAVYETV
jgi:hypothetical protein